MYDVHRNKWARIAKAMHGRRKSTIKNFFYGTLKRKIKRISDMLMSVQIRNSYISSPFIACTSAEIHELIEQKYIFYKDIQEIEVNRQGGEPHD